MRLFVIHLKKSINSNEEAFFIPKQLCVIKAVKEVYIGVDVIFL